MRSRRGFRNADVGLCVDSCRSGGYSCGGDCNYYSRSETQEKNKEFIGKKEIIMANEAHKIKLLLLWDILCKNTDEDHALNTGELTVHLSITQMQSNAR